MSKFAITYTPCFRKNMTKELLNIDKNISVEGVLSDSVLIVESKYETKDFIDKLLKISPTFIKHSMPIMAEGKISENFEIDKNEILKQIRKISDLKRDENFSIQCRIIAGGKSGLSYSSKDLEVFVGQIYENNGSKPVFSDSDLLNKNIKIGSILINKNKFYVGFSSSEENLNFHSDEYRVCSKNGREISRAENKLKEALSKFNINLSGKGYALDIGAAPGGWTKVLADYGYNVVAVDPGNLKSELENNEKIQHFKCRIEDLVFDNFFDIIVNDMNVNPQTTAHIMNNLSNSLKDDGMAVVTLKLPNKVEEDIEESLNILSNSYDVVTTKSLFHNRQEVTTLIRKKVNTKDFEEPGKTKILTSKKN